MAIMLQININQLVLAMETSCVFCDCTRIYLFFCGAIAQLWSRLLLLIFLDHTLNSPTR